MKDVAAAAGVSVQTVSNTINGRTNRMGRDTEARVRAAIDSLGFRPNSSARGLRSRSTRTLAFFIGDAAKDYLADPLTDLFLAGMSAELRQEGNSLLIDSYVPGQTLDSVARHLDEGRVDGAVLLLSGPEQERRRAFNQLARRGRPLVLLQEHSPLGRGVRSVSAKDYEGSYRLCQHLIDLGHKRIAYLNTVEHWSALEQRTRGYRDALDAAGLGGAADVRKATGFSPRAGLEAGLDLLGGSSRPTAIMCGNDYLAMGVLGSAARLGIRVPDDVAVTGFNDFAFAEVAVPSITTVRLPGYVMGVRAARILLDLPEAGASGDLEDVQLMLRDSTGAAPGH
ncbi:LacI family DNA-binding transcriptional regulator [Amnibacterium sp. CER49]|uniref:LacI family DNA-binding transcriptional regulator n=1 Tax=Amnibacterium sp. CER49 TaxID=3039161 RepID=UPI00244BC213|nr:LacI family DNA-binding transcriptional regulator [Amnibacterium sp. CER49]MDH2442856.1 LacI family DNA-binding transcriptional regulator [Amnibacterium sp. CER49]